MCVLGGPTPDGALVMIAFSRPLLFSRTQIISSFSIFRACLSTGPTAARAGGQMQPGGREVGGRVAAGGRAAASGGRRAASGRSAADGQLGG